MRTSFLGFLWLVPVVLVSAAACGGSALENKGGIGGSNGLAGTSAAGTGAIFEGSGGSSGGAFQGVGGTSTGKAGSASGGAASGGSGGSDISACTSNAQCKLVPVSCCSCGMSEPIESYLAINSAAEMQFDKRCETVDCAPCGPGVSPGPNDPGFYYIATCQRPAEAAPDAPGHCVAVDLRKTEITACNSAADCSLRSGTGCCSGCNGPTVAINVNKGAALMDLVCPSQAIGCALCLPLFDGYKAVCNDGRCGVTETP